MQVQAGSTPPIVCLKTVPMRMVGDGKEPVLWKAVSVVLSVWYFVVLLILVYLRVSICYKPAPMWFQCGWSAMVNGRFSGKLLLLLVAVSGVTGPSDQTAATQTRDRCPLVGKYK